MADQSSFPDLRFTDSTATQRDWLLKQKMLN